MRVLWVTDLFPHAGRPHMGRWLVDLAASLSRHVEVTVLSPRYRFLWTPRGSFLEWYERQPARVDYGGVRAIYPDCPAIPTAFYMILQSLSMVWGLWPAAREEHRRRPFDLVHGQPIIPGGWAAARIARRLGLPLVVTGQGADVNEFSAIRHLAPLFRSACHSARVTAVSRALVDRLSALGFPATWIPNGCRGPAAPRERVRGRILFVGLLYERKAPDVLLRAFARVRAAVPEATLDFIGEGVDAPALRAAAGPGVRFLGALPHDRVRELMEEADVFCLPSRREGWPLVVVEAMAAGLPVIATDIGGTREIVTRSELGTLVPPGDAESLASALIVALRAPWDRARLREEALRYDWDRIADQYLDVYRAAAMMR